MVQPEEHLLSIHRQLPSLTVTTDASDMGWGAVYQGCRAGGPWTLQDTGHINWRELLAAFLGLQTFTSKLQGLTIRLELDNTTAVAYINRQGGTHSAQLCTLAIDIWQWAKRRNLFLYAVHLPGKLNVDADYLSRHVRESGDWMLPRSTFRIIQEHCSPLQVDLFAARHNHQLQQYVSWHPDPGAIAVDALSAPNHLWEDGYLFPPICLVSACLQYVHKQQVQRCVLVAPAWCSQAYFPRLLEMLVELPWRLPSSVVLNAQGDVHPLGQQLKLAVWTISGNRLLHKAFRDKLPLYGSQPGGAARMQHINQSGRNGVAGVTDGRCIPWQTIPSK